METKQKTPMITVQVSIADEFIKELKEMHKINAMVNKFPSIVAGHIKGLIVEKLASGEFAKFQIDFDEDFGTVPPGPIPFIDTLPVSLLSQRA